ncbi:Scr1 family TA system antitoxin-like transcriptional regulator [Micromonospora sp. LOL_023]|uniref:Scr1 family TA system antitoxin-like transcriptional regulator n=1 Tax=Micromonospora sp. LOL_023 TaxID=3345418 RepID=UPI003A8BD1F9
MNRRVEARLLRQTIVKGRDAPQLWAILDEAAVRRGVGGSDVMREQLTPPRVVQQAGERHHSGDSVPYRCLHVDGRRLHHPALR